jgi:hypothetical protein
MMAHYYRKQEEQKKLQDQIFGSSAEGVLKYPTQGFARKVRQPTQVRQKHFENIAEHWSTINSC